jgi:hypothetical protein
MSRVHEVVALFLISDVPMVSFWMMIVVQNRWRFLA